MPTEKTNKNKTPVKLSLLIEDFSAIGGLSLSIAISILSALGIKIATLPTQILSTQTEGFGKPKNQKLNSWIKNSFKHWSKISDLNLSSVLTGYIGNIQICKLIEKFISTHNFKQIIIDPVMGDEGKLYPNLNSNYINVMRKLISQANVITPNLTELSLLSNTFLNQSSSNQKILKAISKLPKKTQNHTNIVITGIKRNNKYYCCWKKPGTKFRWYGQKIFPGHFYGAGDLFSALITGFLNKKIPLKTTIYLTMKATNIAIKETSKEKINTRKYGLNLKNTINYISNLE